MMTAEEARGALTPQQVDGEFQNETFSQDVITIVQEIFLAESQFKLPIIPFAHQKFNVQESCSLSAKEELKPRRIDIL